MFSNLGFQTFVYTQYYYSGKKQSFLHIRQKACETKRNEDDFVLLVTAITLSSYT